MRPGPPTDADLNLRAPRILPHPIVAAFCSTDDHDRAAHTYGRSFRDRNPGIQLPIPQPARRNWLSPQRDRADHRPGLVLETPTLWRFPTAVAVPWWPAWNPRKPTPWSTIDLTRPRPGAGDRRHFPRRSHPGRRIGAGFGSAAAPPWLHPASLPPELRVLHPRRLDRHPQRRPLRYQPHPHRRLRRVRPHGHSFRRVGNPAGLPGSGAGPSPDRMVIGQRGHFGSHHRGLDAYSGPAALPRLRRHRVRRHGGRV